ncbi:hypothetical protein AVEN_14718-1 [Araneus ventricosus]|uniref:Uncharacterized protein n=1 Tax=Araneus ventricosus TaxID=182803 RepID=A0A4Y2SQ23_ARAVE|nr:hypothetical protein AVEN_14718-1 [Araneus ventricosus]
MNKASFFFGGVLTTPLIWMWIQIFVFHEAAYLISLGVYLFLFIVLAGEILGNKAPKMDRAVQTVENRMKDEYVQTEDFSVMNSSSEIHAFGDELTETELEEFSSESLAMGDVWTDTEEEESSSVIHAKAFELAETEEEESSPEIDPDSPALDLTPGPPGHRWRTPSLGPNPFKSLFIKVKRKKLKFLVPTDPNLFTDDAMPTKDDNVCQWYLQYIKEKHEKKKLSFFQRKMRKMQNRFKKK